MRRLCYLYKLASGKLTAYLYDLIPHCQRLSRNIGYIYEPFCQTVPFENSFLLYAIKEWHKLDSEIRNSETYVSFRKMLLNFIRTTGNSPYNIYDLFEVKLLTRLRLGFSHLSEHKIRHNFAVSLNPLCSCSLKTESTLHFCSTPTKLCYFTKSPYIDSIMSLNENDLLHVTMYGNKKFDNNMNIRILTATIKFIKGSESFDQPHF